MSAVEQPISPFYKGEDRTYTIFVVDEEGDAVDITGFGIEWQVKTGTGVVDPPSISKSVGSGITITPDQVANKGEATLEINPTDTSSLAAAIYKYDLVVIDLSAERQLVIAPSTFNLLAVVNQA